MRLAGGSDLGDETSVAAFMAQAAAYETEGDAWDRVIRMFNTAFREHPFNTVRAGELERWRASGAYEAILTGTYARRGEKSQGLGDDFSDAASYYSSKTSAAMSNVGDAFGRARDAFADAFRGKAGPPTVNDPPAPT